MGGLCGMRCDDVREARPPDQGGASGDHQQALQGRRVVGQVYSVVQASCHEVVYVGDAGTGPGVPSESQRAAHWGVMTRILALCPHTFYFQLI